MSQVTRTITRKVEPHVSPLGTFILDRGQVEVEIVSDDIMIKAIGELKTKEKAGRNQDKFAMWFSLTLDVDGKTLFVTFIETTKPENTQRIERFRDVYERQSAQVEAARLLGEEHGTRGLQGLGKGRIIRGRFDPWVAGLPKDTNEAIDRDNLSVVNKVEWRLMPREKVIEIVESDSIL